MNKAFILGVNYFIGLGVCRRLGEKNIHVVACDYDKDAYGFKSKYIKEKLIVPHYKNEEKKFLDAIIDYAKKQKEKPVLYTCGDPYVEVLDANRDLLKDYFLFPDMPKGLQTSLLEKGSLAEHCKKYGVLIPETIMASEENLKERVKEEIGYPCIIKPVNSYNFVAKFRTKIFYVNNEEELEKYVKMAMDDQQEVFVQRIVKGFDDCVYTYDCYLNEDSKVTHWMSCHKKRQFPINFGASVYTMQEYVPELHEIGSKFLEDVGYKGFAEIEFKKDSENKKFYLIEVNARYTTLDVLINKCGINMPYVTYRELIGKPLKSYHVSKNTGRHFVYFYEDFLAIRAYIKAGQLNLGQVLKSYCSKKAHAIWDIKDPAPYFAFVNELIKKIKKSRKTKRINNAK